MTTDRERSQRHLDGFRRETYTASSPSEAEGWLAELERRATIVEFEQSELPRGRVAVVAYLEDGQADESAHEEVAVAAGAVPTPRAAQPRMCASCGGGLPAPARSGRPRRFCSDVCRSRASRARHPTIPTCGLRAGGWPCDEPAAVVVREIDGDHRSGWSPHGLAVPACELCAELVEQFAVRQPSVMFVGRQPVLEYLASRAHSLW